MSVGRTVKTDNNPADASRQAVPAAAAQAAKEVVAQAAKEVVREAAVQAVAGAVDQAAQQLSAALRAQLPLYGDPRPVSLASHAAVGVLPDARDYSFAAQTPLIPLTIDEFPRAALDYPIAFVGAGLQPFAVTGLTPGSNQFVHEGVWRAGTYVPAYLRRYPFAIVSDADGKARGLILDHASGRVALAAAQGVTPLFNGREPSDLARQAVVFCRNYQAAQARSTLTLALLRAHNLLEPRSVHHTTPGDAAPHLALQFFTITPERVEALGDDVFLALRKAGVLPVIHAQIASQGRWDGLAAELRG